VNDLYGFALPRLKELQIDGDMHFTEEGSRRLGDEVAASVRATLGSFRQVKATGR
jgi:hypothetical protein